MMARGRWPPIQGGQYPMGYMMPGAGGAAGNGQALPAGQRRTGGPAQQHPNQRGPNPNGQNRRGRRNNQHPHHQQQHQHQSQDPQAQLTIPFLSQFSPEQQSRLLGERLYPLVQREQPELAGKITGMLLDRFTNAGQEGLTDLIRLFDSPDSLHEQIAEALEVLKPKEAGKTEEAAPAAAAAAVVATDAAPAAAPAVEAEEPAAAATPAAAPATDSA
eukprot:TRINITY_DN1859_c0_g2_i1.p2 TRINITY_DN1859_c0_g2~~TRINITY_DN1859_c0_g2_i1.p2  ORF type:complete len:217 (+),score=62.95 TRINITY_DN1859_c0_g2_i1:306-956(+)